MKEATKLHSNVKFRQYSAFTKATKMRQLFSYWWSGSLWRPFTLTIHFIYINNHKTKRQILSSLFPWVQSELCILETKSTSKDQALFFPLTIGENSKRLSFCLVLYSCVCAEHFYLFLPLTFVKAFSEYQYHRDRISCTKKNREINTLLLNFEEM